MEILVVDDDRATREWIGSVLEAEGYICYQARNWQEAESSLRSNQVNLALLDIYLGADNGVDFVRRIKTLQPDCDCVMMTAHASVETMARAVKDGATEYLGKPLRIDYLLGLVRRLENRQQSRSKVADVADVEPEGFAGTAIVGRSARMLEVYRCIARVAPTDATVLIIGPSGSGKERVARSIHAHSRRATKLMTAINCGALAESVLESELFGHEKGAFTGAEASRRGLFENSNGGTIFLDEISETTPGFQVKLLRVLQERQVRRLGSNADIPVDVRILAATNADLGERIRTKQFREDLYYRLSVVAIHLPSLEERREDIPLLVRHFLARFNERNSRQVTVREEATSLLSRMAWPGNVRELENLIERAAILSTTDEITADDVEHASGAGALRGAKATEEVATTLKGAERQQIVRALREAAGNRSLAARSLGIERKTLYKKARRLGIDLDAPI
jgi:Response regulator containing CheY-like receiver, AAA-type ATPase, and DNA-binding domains